MTDQPPKPGNAPGLPDDAALLDVFPYLIIPRPGVFEVRNDGRLVGRISAQPGTWAFVEECMRLLDKAEERWRAEQENSAHKISDV